jgi:hypothetical protein
MAGTKISYKIRWSGLKLIPKAIKRNASVAGTEAFLLTKITLTKIKRKP